MLLSRLQVLFQYLSLDPKPLAKHLKTFQVAFTHRSAANERSVVEHNERLEFLGDAVLELVVTEYLFHAFKGAPEGTLTSYRSAVVKREHLANIARRLKFGEMLILSKGEALSGGREKDYILANTLEAFIGALYLTYGFESVERFITTFILSDLKAILARGEHIDPKTAFQEFVQGQFGITPHYQLLSEKGKDHEKVFTMAAFVGKKQVGKGKGSSKKQAQIMAAQDALKKKDQWSKALENGSAS